MNDNKILVTGATGFIGRHLVRGLVGRHKCVRLLVRKDSDIELFKGSGVEFCYGDILDKGSLKRAVDGAGVIFHLAGKIDTKDSKEAVSILDMLNVQGTKNLLEACCQSRISRFIYFSSVAVLGQGRNGMVFDENSASNPVTAYGKSKYEAERLVFKYLREKGLPITVLRPAPVYGEGESRDICRLIKLIEKGILIQIGKCNNLRSLLYVGDLIEAAVLVLDKPQSIGQLYIVSDDRPYSLNEIIDTITAELGIRINKISVPYWTASFFRLPIKFFSGIDINVFALDRIYSNKKINQDLGFQPRVNLKEGIKRTIIWLKEQNKV